MPRLLPFLLALAAVAAGCGDDAAPSVETEGGSSTTAVDSTTTPTPTSTQPPAPSSTTTVPVPTSTLAPDFPPEDLAQGPLPPLLVGNGTRIDFVQSTIDRDVKVSPLLTTQAPIIDLRQASDGSVFTQEFRMISESEGVHEVWHYVGGVGAAVEGADQLFDVAVVNGVESVIVGAVPDEEFFAFGGISALSVADPSTVVAEFGLAAEAEYFVSTADFAAGVLVVSAYADLTESVAFVRPNGEVLDHPSPTDDIPYAEPPLVVAATLSADGTELYWAEGPDWGFIEEEGAAGPIPAQWVLRGSEVASGAELLYWPAGEVVGDTAELAVDSMHDLGSHLVVNRTRLAGTRPENLGAWILDFTVEEPELWVLPLPGIAVAAAVT